jgi:hypothetical protein
MLYDFQDVPVLVSAGFMPDDLPLLAGYWIRLIDLTKLLGAALSMNYKACTPKALPDQVDALEAEIIRLKPDQVQPGSSRGATFYLHHLQLHYEYGKTSTTSRIEPANVRRALLITLYRPYLTDLLDDLSPAQIHWRRRIWREADAAASRTNDILESLARENILDHALPMT